MPASRRSEGSCDWPRPRGGTGSVERLRAAPVLAAHPRRRPFDRLEDLDVAGAAAEVAGERLLDLVAASGRGSPRAAPWRPSGSRACSSRTGRRRGRRRRPAADAARCRSASPSTVSTRRPSHSSAEHQAREHRLPSSSTVQVAALAELAAVLGAGQAQSSRSTSSSVLWGAKDTSTVRR